MMRARDRGRSFLITRNGVPVGELMPVGDRTFAAVEAVRAALAGAARLDARPHVFSRQ